MLETLCVQGNVLKLRIRLVSQSLRCVKIIGCFIEEIFVLDAPNLERFIYFDAWHPVGNCTTTVKIGHAPKLHLLGYLALDPRKHVLDVGNTIIKVPHISINWFNPTLHELCKLDIFLLLIGCIVNRDEPKHHATRCETPGFGGAFRSPQ